MCCRAFALLSLVLLVFSGCADAPPPKHIVEFEGATHVIAPATVYYSEPLQDGRFEYYAEPPTEDQEPTGQFNPRAKLNIVEETDEYIKVLTENDEEFYMDPRVAPAGEFRAGTRIEILEETEQYTKVRTSDGMEAYVEPTAVKKKTPEG